MQSLKSMTDLINVGGAFQHCTVYESNKSNPVSLFIPFVYSSWLLIGTPTPVIHHVSLWFDYLTHHAVWGPHHKSAGLNGLTVKICKVCFISSMIWSDFISLLVILKGQECILRDAELRPSCQQLHCPELIYSSPFHIAISKCNALDGQWTIRAMEEWGRITE